MPCPTGKKRWGTRKRAKQALKECKRNSYAGHRREEKAAYRCPHCGGFHLTSKKQDWEKQRDAMNRLLKVRRG